MLQKDFTEGYLFLTYPWLWVGLEQTIKNAKEVSDKHAKVKLMMLSLVKQYFSVSDFSSELLVQLSLILRKYFVESHLEHKADKVVCSIITQELN